MFNNCKTSELPNEIAKRRLFIGHAGKTYYNPVGSRSAIQTDDPEAKAIFDKNQWFKADEVVMEEFRASSPITQWLIKRGLSIAAPVKEREDKNEEAEVENRLASHGDEDTPTHEVTTLPLPLLRSQKFMPMFNPLTFEEFKFNAQNVGMTCDLQILGRTFPSLSSTPVPGLLSYPDRYTMYGDFPANFIRMKKVIGDSKHYGPYAIICHKDNTTMVRNISGLFGVQMEDVIPSSWIPLDEFVMFQYTSDVIRLVTLLDPVTVQSGNDGFEILASITPQIRSAHDHTCGVVHLMGDIT